MKKKEYIEPSVKVTGVDAEELMGLSALDKNQNSQDVEPSDENYDGEFGVNSADWDAEGNYIKYEW